MAPRAVAVVDDGAVLVIHRLRDGVAYYTLPGGSVEGGETIEQACIRELRFGEPEASRTSATNRYRPMWLPLTELADVDLRPDEARQELMRLAPGLTAAASDASGGGR